MKPAADGCKNSYKHKSRKGEIVCNLNKDWNDRLF